MYDVLDFPTSHVMTNTFDSQLNKGKEKNIQHFIFSITGIVCKQLISLLMNLSEISLINNQYCCAIKGLPRGSLDGSGRGSMDPGLSTAANGKERVPQAKDVGSSNRCSFHMPLHYPRYTGADYESMPEWMLDRLLSDYGILIDAAGDVDGKRRFAMGTFLWPAAH